MSLTKSCKEGKKSETFAEKMQGIKEKFFHSFCFHGKFFWESLKKEKGLMILLVLLVPLFTSIMLLSIKEGVPTMFELALPNVILMYIIPFVLSSSLFHFVHKKNSADLIGSMPLSRGTIFMTNTIGGFFVIVVLQLLTAICSLTISGLLSSMTLFPAMVWDIFIYQTIAYFFVFVVSNLAMSFSGTRMAQLVATMLILFLVPFLVLANQAYGLRASTSVVGDMNSVIRLEEVSHNFTAPSSMIDMIFFGGKYEYNIASMTKMVMLSVAYIVTGYLLFNKKKYEMAGEAFENRYIHLGVKLLTLIPFIFLFSISDESDKRSIFLFFIGILAVYYFVFDLITNKKLSLKLSILGFVISPILVYGFLEGIVVHIPISSSQVVTLEEVKKIQINGLAENRSVFPYKVMIEEKDLINKILVERNQYKAEDIRVKVTLLLKNGKKANESISISKQDLMQALLKKEAQEAWREELLKVSKNSEIYLPTIDLTKEEKQELMKAIEGAFSTISYDELLECWLEEQMNYEAYLYMYQDHMLKEYAIACNFSSEVSNQIINKYRAYTSKNVVDLKGSFHIASDILGQYMQKQYPQYFVAENETIENSMDVVYFAEALWNLRNSEGGLSYIQRFIQKDSKNEFDVDKEYISIRFYNPSINYCTNDLQLLSEFLLESVKEEHGEDFRLIIDDETMTKARSL